MAKPIWQASSVLQSTVDAPETTRINIARLVTLANQIEMVGGFQEWLDFDGADLEVTPPILHDDSEFRVKFRATNADGYSDAFYSLTVNASKLAMLQNTLFFNEPITYDGDRVRHHGTPTIIREMTDNNYETYSTVADIDVDMSDVDGTATPIDYIFLKYKGDLRAYTCIPSGGQGSNFTRTLPATVENYEGNPVSLEVNGFKHDLYPLSQRVTATSLRMQFSGTDVEIYTLMCLEFGHALDANSEFLKMNFDQVDRVGITSELQDGTGSRDAQLGAEREKWEYQFTVFLKRGEAKKLFYWMEQHLNFGFAAEFARQPSQVFPAFWGLMEVLGQPLTQNKNNGDRIEFSVSEQ